MSILGQLTRLADAVGLDLTRSDSYSPIDFVGLKRSRDIPDCCADQLSRFESEVGGTSFLCSRDSVVFHLGLNWNVFPEGKGCVDVGYFSIFGPPSQPVIYSVDQAGIYDAIEMTSPSEPPIASRPETYFARQLFCEAMFSDRFVRIQTSMDSGGSLAGCELLECISDDRVQFLVSGDHWAMRDPWRLGDVLLERRSVRLLR